jgi:hypothetical protein
MNSIASIFINPFNKQVFRFFYGELTALGWKQYATLLLFYLLGYALLRTISPHFSVRERIGLSALLGVAGSTMLLFLILLLVPQHLSFYTFSLTSSMCTLLMLAFSFKVNPWTSFLTLKEFREKRKEKWQALRRINLVFLMALLLILYCATALFLKSVFWPVADWDAITTFDFYARVIVREKGLVNSVILNRNVMTGVAYPPMTTLSVAISYLGTFASPKFLFPWLYFSFLLTFYCFLKKFVNGTNAIVFTLLIILTPELSAFSTFVKTNVIQMIYASLGIVSLLIWVEVKQWRYFYLSAILLGLNAWTRSEGIEFMGVGMALVSWHCFKGRKVSGRQLFVYVLLCITPFLSWQLYLSATPALSAYSAVSIIKQLFWDQQRMSSILFALQKLAFHQQYFGLVFYLVVAALLLHIVLARANKREYLYVLLLFTLILLHVGLLYQFEYSTHEEMMRLLNHSLKRYIFNWIPLACFVIANSLVVKWLFNKLEQLTLR